MSLTAKDWAQKLHDARKSLKLSRARLAELSGVSSQTVKAYELGLRHPSRGMLTAVLDALKLERPERDVILTLAGFAPDGPSIGPKAHPRYMFDLAEAATEVCSHPWPSFVLNELMEVVVANPVVEKLWGVEVLRDYPDLKDRNMVAFATHPAFADRVANWDDLVSVAMSVFRGHHLGEERPETPSPYFARVLDRLLAGQPQYVSRFMRIWQEVQGRDPKVRWWYPVVWEEPGIGTLTFRALVTTCNEERGLAFNDWIPIDARTWEGLGKLMARR